MSKWILRCAQNDRRETFFYGRSERVQIDQNLPRTRPVLGTDDTLFLHDLHDAGGAIVADAQAALQHRGAGALRRFQDIERLLIQLLVVAQIVVAAPVFAGEEELVEAGARADARAGAASLAVAAVVAPEEPVRTRVLVADDNQDAAETLAALLRAAGHETATAYDGKQALDLLDHGRFDVAVLDIGMPRLNGYDVAEQVRRGPKGAHIRLVALTGWGQTEDRRRALAAGFDDHLTKPVHPESLLALIASSGAAEARDRTG